VLEILLVDDDESVRQSLTLLLGHEGFRVTTAGGGFEALELAQKQSFDLVISDIRMPDMDGFEVVSRLREILAEANFALMTGFISEDSPIQALRMQVDDYFRKPLDMVVFLERIQHLRRQREQRRVAQEQTLERFVNERLDPLTRQTLRLAVRFQGMVAGLAGARPLFSDLSVQLLLAAMHLRMGQAVPEGLDGRIIQELSNHHIRNVLKVYTLGQTRFTLDEAEIPHSQFESQRARWLILYLLSRRGQWVASEHLREIFWPESDSDKAQRSLVSTIHRCRKALGECKSLLQRGERGYCLEPSAQIWWDLDQLEHCHRQSQSQQAESALLQLEALYQGEFSPDCPYEWAEPLRHKAHRLTLEGLEKLARLLLKRDPAASEARARKALRLDPTAEGAAETLLRSLWSQDRRGEGVRFYRDFSMRLERDFNLPPGPQIVCAYLELGGA